MTTISKRERERVSDIAFFYFKDKIRLDCRTRVARGDFRSSDWMKLSLPPSVWLVTVHGGWLKVFTTIVIDSSGMVYI